MRRRAIRSRGPRRKFDWEHGIIDYSIAFSQGGGDYDIAAGWVRVPASNMDTLTDAWIEPEWTLVRSIIQAKSLIYQTGTTTPTFYEIFAGLIAVDGFAGLNIPTEIPAPSAGGGDWIWRQYSAFHIGDGGGALPARPTSGQADNTFGPREQMDSSAQRKLPDNKGVLYVVETIRQTAGTGSAQVYHDADVRLGLKMA